MIHSTNEINSLSQEELTKEINALKLKLNVIKSQLKCKLHPKVLRDLSHKEKITNDLLSHAYTCASTKAA